MHRALGQRPLALPSSARIRRVRGRVEHSCGHRATGSAILTSTLSEAGIDLEIRCTRCRAWIDWQHRLWDLAPDLPEAIDQILFETAHWHGARGEQATVLEAHLTEALGHASTTVDPVALEACRPFAPSVRATIYWAVRHDLTGYVLQLAETKPGVLLLVAHTAPFELTAVRPTNPLPNIPVWREVVAGRSLDTIIDQVAERASHPEAHRARLRWLAKRAPHQCDPSDVLRVSGVTSAPQSDLPSEQPDRAQWIAFLARISYDDYDDIRPSDAIRYASARYRELAELDPTQLDRVFRYIRNSGRRPSRAKPVAQLLVEMEGWYEEWSLHDSIESVLAGLERAQRVLPAPPFEELVSERFQVRPIETLRELYEEGQTMRHCIFSYYDPAIAGHVAIYHVEAHGEPSTLMLQREGSRWCVGEQSGVLNQTPSDRALAAVERWLEEVQRDTEASTQTWI